MTDQAAQDAAEFGAEIAFMALKKAIVQIDLALREHGLRVVAGVDDGRGYGVEKIPQSEFN